MIDFEWSRGMKGFVSFVYFRQFSNDFYYIFDIEIKEECIHPKICSGVQNASFE